MGDRCYLQLTIHGHIRRVAHLEKIVDAIVAEGFTDDREEIYEDLALFDSPESGNPTFEMDECNFGNIDNLEKVLTECRVAWQTSHGAGSEYPAGNRSWSTKHGYNEAGDEVVWVGALRVALTAKRTKAALKRIIKGYDLAAGAEMPTFSTSPEVDRFLAVKVAAKALGVSK